MAAEPSLAPAEAYTTSALLAISYVAILYVLPSARSRPWQKDPRTGRPKDRQHPDVIRARIFAAVLVTLPSLIAIGWLATVHGRTPYSADPIKATIYLTGLFPNYTPTSYLRLCVCPCLLVQPSIMIDHLLGRPSASWKRTQVIFVLLFWAWRLRSGDPRGPRFNAPLSSQSVSRLGKSW